MRKEMQKLLKQAKADEMAKYSDEWQAEAVRILNEYYVEHDADDYIYEQVGYEWEETVKYNLENRGATGLLFLLAKIEPADYYVTLNGYGNGEGVHADELVNRLEWAIIELKNEEDE